MTSTKKTTFNIHPMMVRECTVQQIVLKTTKLKRDNGSKIYGIRNQSVL